MNHQAESVTVWDPVVRVFHWALVVAVGAAFLSQDEWLGLHVVAGYSILGLVLLRIVWGLVGTRHARFGDFFFGPATVIDYLKKLALFRAPRYLGHGPAGGTMVLALLISLLATALTGLAVYGGQEYAGPMWTVMARLDDAWAGVAEGAHEFFAGITLLLASLHIAGVLFSSLAHRENLILAMITGRKRREEATHQGVAKPEHPAGDPHHTGWRVA